MFVHARRTSGTPNPFGSIQQLTTNERHNWIVEQQRDERSRQHNNRLRQQYLEYVAENG